MTLLDGKVAIVTGAGAGIGRSEALSLARQGATVVVNDVSRASADKVASEIASAGGRAVADYSDAADWKTGGTLVDLAVSSFGELDIVVTNAGIMRRNSIVDVSEDELDAQVAVLFKGTYTLFHHAGRYWKSRYEAGVRRHRTIVATSSSAGIPGGVRESNVYGSMKAAVAALALVAALELRPYGITVNTILPHAATRMDAAAKGLPDPGDWDVDDPDPMNPQSVANVVSYLASEQAAWLSGQTFEITGTNVRRWVTWAPAGEVDRDQPWTPQALGDALATTIYGTLPAGRFIPETAGLR